MILIAFVIRSKNMLALVVPVPNRTHSLQLFYRLSNQAWRQPRRVSNFVLIAKMSACAGGTGERGGGGEGVRGLRGVRSGRSALLFVYVTPPLIINSCFAIISDNYTLNGSYG